MLANLKSTGGAVVSELFLATLAPMLGKRKAKKLLGEVTVQAERAAEPLADVLSKALAGEGHTVPDADLAELLDPVRYTGATAGLADRVLRRHRETGNRS